MSDIIHKGFRLKIIVEQVLEVQTYPSTPVDSGRTETTLVHTKVVEDLNVAEFREFYYDPLKSAHELYIYKEREKESARNS